ncbi:MAG TPA: LCP family protein [Actinomycetota bacterium]|nr:LCP family protein [Actinomycetota bacterium]
MTDDDTAFPYREEPPTGPAASAPGGHPAPEQAPGELDPWTAESAWLRAQVAEPTGHEAAATLHAPGSDTEVLPALLDDVAAPPIAPGHTGSPRHRGPRRHRWLRRTLTVVAVLVSLLLIAGVAFFAYANYRINQHGRACSACSNAVAGGASPAPFNVLVMGSDSRAGLTPAEAKLLDPGNENLGSGERADTIALVHVEPAVGKAVVVSIPRDLWVPAPDGGYEKINAYFNDGPNALVAEVSALTGLPIEHYVSIDFTSFGEIDQALGGVSVYFNRPIDDPNSGLHQPKGCDLLSGAQALAFVRDRDTDSDFGRIARQRLFVTLMINKILTPGTLLNPVKVANLINLGLSSLDHDSGLTLSGLLSLVKDFHNFSSSDIDFRVLPSYPNGALVDGQSVVDESTSEANALLTAIRDGSPLPDYGIQGVSPIQPAQVPVTVLDDTGNITLARSTATSLRDKGYPVVETGEATSGQAVTQTVVYFTIGNQTPAQFLQQQQFPAASLQPLPDGDPAYGSPAAIVVLGPDAANVVAQPAPSPSPSGLEPAGPAISIDTASFGAPCAG